MKMVESEGHCANARTQIHSTDEGIEMEESALQRRNAEQSIRVNFDPLSNLTVERLTQPSKQFS
jgi:hypothetical protein